MTSMPPALPVVPDLVNRLSSYAKWLDFLRANNEGWTVQDLQGTAHDRLLAFFNSQPPEAITLFQVRQKGENWNGLFEHDSYLCLCEGEARMVVDQLRRPSPKVRRLYLEHYLHASYRPVTLAEVLASAEHSQRLARRLRELTDYTADAYDRANAAVFWLDGGTSMNLLFCDEQLILPTEANLDLRNTLSWGRHICVWNSDGLGGVMATDGRFLLPCRFAYLNWHIVYNCAEASTESLPDVALPLGHWDFLNYRCDIFDIRSGRQVNPSSAPVLVNSLAFERVFVALSDQYTPDGRPLLGFMDTEGHWVGTPCWADVLLFNDGLAAVQCAETGLWGFINRQGGTVISPQFIDSNFFNDGLAFMQNPTSPHDWYAINKQGEIVTGPWRSIDHGLRNLIVAQDAQDRWALLDMTGQVTLPPQTLPGGLDQDERLKHLADAYRAHRSALVQSLMDAPLHQRVAQLKPQSQRDLVEMKLWFREVSVSELPEFWRALIEPNIAGYIGWEYPVSASTFDLAQEAPITFTKKDGATVSIGIPWQDIQLGKPGDL